MPDRLPNTLPFRATLMRAAGNILGSEQLARLLGISPRKGYQLMAGTSPVHNATLDRVRGLLIEHRQATGALIQLIRQEQGR